MTHAAEALLVVFKRFANSEIREALKLQCAIFFDPQVRAVYNELLLAYSRLYSDDEIQQERLCKEVESRIIVSMKSNPHMSVFSVICRELAPTRAGQEALPENVMRAPNVFG